MEWLTALAYALSRGFWSAYLDVLKERESAREETVTDVDRLRADRFRDAVRGVPGSGPGASTTGSDHSPPSGGDGQRSGLGSPP